MLPSFMCVLELLLLHRVQPPLVQPTYALSIVVARRNPLSSSASNCIPQMLLVFYQPQLSELRRS
jgi:hypothetical protein